MHCFERANLPREMAVANAYYLREQARSLLGSSPQRNGPCLKAFIKAAEAFLDCASSASKETRTYFSVAADCFERGDDIKRAAKANLDAENFTRAAQLYRKVGMFDEAVQIVKDHKEKMEAHIADSIVDIARLYYFKEHELEYVLQQIISCYADLDTDLQEGDGLVFFTRRRVGILGGV